MCVKICFPEEENICEKVGILVVFSPFFCWLTVILSLYSVVLFPYTSCFVLLSLINLILFVSAWDYQKPILMQLRLSILKV